MIRNGIRNSVLWIKKQHIFQFNYIQKLSFLGLKWNDSPCSFETYFVCELLTD